MKYQIAQMKLEVLIQYLQAGTISLTPAFQRGRVWVLRNRQNLLKNVLQGKPIPAIFLYKEATGSRYSYIILDGKQRLESLLLFIGDQRQDLHIPAWKSYFSRSGERAQAHFSVNVNGAVKRLSSFTDEEVLKFRDYLLSTIEIDLDETTSLDEIIQLFVDINQQGVAVKRFNIVKALYLKDALLLQIFDQLAMKQKRREDVFYKLRQTSFSKVLGRLEIVARTTDVMTRVDKMWEKLFELALYSVSNEHRKPVQILKEFITKRMASPKLSSPQLGLLKRVFSYLARAYANSALGDTRWATDQVHFYTMITALISLARPNRLLATDLADKLVKFDALLGGERIAGLSRQTSARLKEYTELSAKQTTDISKRARRQQLFVEIVNAL